MRSSMRGPKFVAIKSSSGHDEIMQPAVVRYGWADYPTGNLFNKAGLPASLFETDKITDLRDRFGRRAQNRVALFRLQFGAFRFHIVLHQINRPVALAARCQSFSKNESGTVDLAGGRSSQL